MNPGAFWPYDLDIEWIKDIIVQKLDHLNMPLNYILMQQNAVAWAIKINF